MPNDNHTETAPEHMEWAQQAQTIQCSVQICPNGHNWCPQLAITHCKGCQSPILALRMLNCPVCNEPPVSTQLRVDHLGGAHPITKVCQKEHHIGPEYIKVKIDHTHTAWIADDHAPTNPQSQSLQVGCTKLGPAPDGETALNSAPELDGRL